MTQPILTAEYLSLIRDGVAVFQNASLRVRPATLSLIKGENGSGKSSLLKILAGVLRPSNGTLLNTAARAHYIGHDSGLAGDMTVAENLTFYARLNEAIYGDNMLSYFELHAVAAVPVRHLSRGYQQRVALTRLFFGAGDLWLLDEPESHLDAASKEKLVPLLQQFMRKGGAAVIATHGALFDGLATDAVRLKQ